MSTEPTNRSTPPINIPSDLLPNDGRFGCGPSKVRPEAMASLASVGQSWLGTSHRQAGVKNVVSQLKSNLASLFKAPDGYEVVFGNGGSTVFWDVATFSLIQSKSQHTSYGEFSAKFAAAALAAPHLSDPSILGAEPGSFVLPEYENGVDTYALVHNETSTGVAVNPIRPKGIGEALVIVDATSAAGGLNVDLSEIDVYYFAPQKCFASDGGLWVAICSPRALERIEVIKKSKRWMPATLDLSVALEQSKLNQTYNTPSLSTLWLMSFQTQWICDNGGLDWASARCATSAKHMYRWAEESKFATPFVKQNQARSNVVATIDFDVSVNADEVCKVLRTNGIVDTDSYRKLGRNQIRVAMFPAIDPEDLKALTACIDYVVENL